MGDLKWILDIKLGQFNNLSGLTHIPDGLNNWRVMIYKQDFFMSPCHFLSKQALSRDHVMLNMGRGEVNSSNNRGGK